MAIVTGVGTDEEVARQMRELADALESSWDRLTAASRSVDEAISSGGGVVAQQAAQEVAIAGATFARIVAKDAMAIIAAVRAIADDGPVA